MAVLEVLGSGGAFSPLETAYLVNDNILIDCGASVVKKLIKEGRAGGITHVFITHVHQDHCNGLEALVYYKRHVVRNPNSSLVVFCGPEVADYISTLACSYVEDFDVSLVQTDRVSLSWKNFDFPPITVGDIKFIPVQTLHSRGEISSFGLIVVNGDERLAITGDVDDVVDIEPSRFIAVFHDAGWTNIPDRADRVHPFAYDVAKLGSNVFCVHTDADVTADGARPAPLGGVLNF